jgi:hypothetical protein
MKGHGDRWVVPRRLLPEALMRPVLVKVLGIFVEDRDRVRLVVDQHPVGALLPHTANEPFGIAIGHRSRLHRMRMIGIDVSG